MWGPAEQAAAVLCSRASPSSVARVRRVRRATDRRGLPCSSCSTQVITPNINDSVESLVEKEAALKKYYVPPSVDHLLEPSRPLVRRKWSLAATLGGASPSILGEQPMLCDVRWAPRW